MSWICKWLTLGVTIVLFNIHNNSTTAELICIKFLAKKIDKNIEAIKPVETIVDEILNFI